jgi:hypothetical protein
MKIQDHPKLQQPQRTLEEWAPEEAAPWGHREDQQEHQRKRAQRYLARLAKKSRQPDRSSIVREGIERAHAALMMRREGIFA